MNTFPKQFLLNQHQIFSLSKKKKKTRLLVFLHPHIYVILLHYWVDVAYHFPFELTCKIFRFFIKSLIDISSFSFRTVHISDRQSDTHARRQTSLDQF